MSWGISITNLERNAKVYKRQLEELGYAVELEVFKFGTKGATFYTYSSTGRARRVEPAAIPLPDRQRFESSYVA